MAELIVTFKRENPSWGQRRIREELRRMGICVSAPTVVRILREHGFSPQPGRKIDFSSVRAAAKDALWALDFFAVQTGKGVWLQALLIIDIYTRELLELRVHDGWDVDSVWTTQVLDAVVRRTRRKPTAVVHDHGPHFLGTFARQLRVLEIEEETTPSGLPSMNCYAERAIGSIRRELLRHMRVADAKELQFLLDEYRAYANTERPHQGLCGRTPEEASTGLPEAEVIDMAAARERRQGDGCPSPESHPRWGGGIATWNGMLSPAISGVRKTCADWDQRRIGDDGGFRTEVPCCSPARASLLASEEDRR